MCSCVYTCVQVYAPVHACRLGTQQLPALFAGTYTFGIIYAWEKQRATVAGPRAIANGRPNKSSRFPQSRSPTGCPQVCVLFPLGHSVLQTILYKRADDFMASTIHVSSLACTHTHAVKETQLAPSAGLGRCWVSDPKWL